MGPIDPATSPHLIASLAAVAQRHPVGRKLLVADTVGAGRELLRRLALETGGWVGFEATTLRPLALSLARRRDGASGAAPLDPFEERALMDEALDAVLSGADGVWADLSESVGFRERVHGAVQALRLAGLGPGAVARAHISDEAKRTFLTRVLSRYERLLGERRRLDTAGVFGSAVEALEATDGGLATALGVEAVLLTPGLGTRGLAGRLVGALTSRGARVLPTDPVVGRDVPDAVLWARAGAASGHAYLDAPDGLPADVDPPDVSVFHAASVTDELREVLRRVLAEGRRWDEVEVVAADPAAYGSALHALSFRLGIPVTYAVGLPVERTRVGRTAAAYLEWVSEGFQAATLRRLLEAGDLRPGRRYGRIAPAALARRFRSLRIGWGRKRYRTRIRAALEAAERMGPRHGESRDSFERRQARTRAELEALRSIVFPVLRETPHVPDRATDAGAPVSPAELARGLRAFLRRVPAGTGPEAAAREEIVRTVERAEETLRRRTHFRGALAILRGHLEIRVRAEAPDADGERAGAPWASEGGHLHLSDLEHGGYSGRPRVFFVGMDADQVPGQGGQDPLLLDGERRVLGRALPTSSEVIRERTFRASALFARLRGAVTLSHTSWSAAEGRPRSPSPFMLQALRLGRRDGRLTFEGLRHELGAVVCARPRPGRPFLDADDVWMDALGDGPVLRAGLDAVRVGYPPLERGLRARDARGAPHPGPFHGVVAARRDVLDPREATQVVLSSARLETLGKCPLAYLYKVALGLRPPDDPEMDPDGWLDPMARGSLLHGVFEASLRAAKEQGVRLADPAFETLAEGVLAEGVVRLQEELPVPGDGTLRRELTALREDVRSWVRMVRERGAPWVRLEFGFGFDDDPPVELPVEGGVIRLRGTVDRIDDAGIDGIRVVDYKTGRARDFGKSGTYDGGRRLQHALYTRVVGARLGVPVVAAEYHFPTLRGQHDVHAFDVGDLAGAEALLGTLLDGVAAGAFVPTNDANDCKYCEYAEICRVRGSYNDVESPLAMWSAERLDANDHGGVLDALKGARDFEG